MPKTRHFCRRGTGMGQIGGRMDRQIPASLNAPYTFGGRGGGHNNNKALCRTRDLYRKWACGVIVRFLIASKNRIRFDRFRSAQL